MTPSIYKNFPKNDHEGRKNLPIFHLYEHHDLRFDVVGVAPTAIMCDWFYILRGKTAYTDKMQ